MVAAWRFNVSLAGRCEPLSIWTNLGRAPSGSIATCCRPTVVRARQPSRTAAITGASLAVAMACRRLVREKVLDASPVQKLVAAVSAGVLDGQAVLDLNYQEDKTVSVDFNLVATEDGEFVEVQGSGEEATFTQAQLEEMLALAQKGIAALIGAQRSVLARIMVTPPEN